jgi:hypothetical protein
MLSLTYTTKKLHLLLGMVSVLLPFTPLNAQEASLQFVSFPVSHQPEPLELRVGKEKTVEIEAPSFEFSPILKVPDPGVWEFGKTIINAEGKSEFKVYGRVKSSGKQSQLIILMRRGASYEEGLTATLVNTDPGEFVPPSYLLLNTTKTTIAMKMGEEVVTLEPSKEKIVKPKPNVAEMVVQVSMAYKAGEEWKVFSETRWPVYDRCRTLVFFHSDETGKLQRHSITDCAPLKP